MALSAQVQATVVDAHDLVDALQAGQCADDRRRRTIGCHDLHLKHAAVRHRFIVRLNIEGNTALLRDGWCVHEGDLLIQHAGEHATQCSQAQRVHGLARQLTAGGDLHGGRSSIHKLGGNGAQLRRQTQPQRDLFGDTPAGHVDGVWNEVAGQRLQHGSSHIGTGPVLGFDGRCAQVWGHDNFVEFEQRGVSAWLGGVNVETSAADVSGLDGLSQCGLINQATAGGVDDDLPLLGLRQQVSVEHACSFFGLRQVDRHEVGTAHQLFELNQFHTQLRCAGWVGVWVISDDVRLESGEALGEQLTNVAEADDTDGLAQDFHALEGGTLPLAITQCLIGCGDLAGGAQQQADRVLTCGVNVGRWSVGNHHALGGGGWDVDVVQAHAGATDDLQVLGGVEDFLVNSGGGTNQQCVCVDDCLQ